MATNEDVDKFMKNAKIWKKEIAALRTILLKTPLEEDFKWRLPCYTFQQSNVAIIQPRVFWQGIRCRRFDFRYIVLLVAN